MDAEPWEGLTVVSEDPYAVKKRILTLDELIVESRSPQFSTKYLQSFVVINTRLRKKYIYRFSANPAFYCLEPWHPVRRLLIMVSTNQLFDYLIMLTILTNCVFLALPYEVKPAEYAFLAIYTMECVIKILSRGLIMDNYTYLRDPWNWLDLIVVITSYVMIIVENTLSSNNVNVGSLRTFRVFRVLKTISIFPGLRTIISALLKSFRMLLEVIILTFFCLSVFSLFALQIYMGTFRNKCVKAVDWSAYNDSSADAGVNATNAFYYSWIKDEANWLANDDGSFWLCGNASGAGQCSGIEANFTCLPDLGDNPNWGYTSFDNFGWSLLSLFQLITLDFWENLYNHVIRSSGPWSILFFIVIVFFGSFYLINLMLAVVTMSYQEEALVVGKAQEREKKEKWLRKKRQQKRRQTLADYSFDPERLKKMKRRPKAKKRSGERGSNVSGGSGAEPSGGTDGGTAAGGAATSDVTGADAAAAGVVADASAIGGADGANGSRVKPLLVAEAVTATATAAADENKAEDGPAEAKPAAPAPAADANRRERAESDSKGESDSGMGSQGDGNDKATMAQDEAGEEEDEDNEPVMVIDESGAELMDRNWPCCADCCIGYNNWLRCQNQLFAWVTDPFFELFIIACIVVNTAFMASEFYPMSQAYSDALNWINNVFTMIFTLEAVLKMMAMSRQYFTSPWNLFDLFVVVTSVIDLGVQENDNLAIFRAVRLFRVFRLAQSWETMRKLLQIIYSAMSAVGHLTFILFIIIFIFAVIGMQLFDNSYTPAVFGSAEAVPRWNFEDFAHSMLMVFRILCGEWIEALWDCMRANGQLCMVVFIPTLILGNFMVLNLFLALLLNSFSNDKLAKDVAADGSQDDASRFAVAGTRLRRLFCCCLRPSSDEAAADAQAEAGADAGAAAETDAVAAASVVEAESASPAAVPVIVVVVAEEAAAEYAAEDERSGEAVGDRPRRRRRSSRGALGRRGSRPLKPEQEKEQDSTEGQDGRNLKACVTFQEAVTVEQPQAAKTEQKLEGGDSAEISATAADEVNAAVENVDGVGETDADGDAKVAEEGNSTAAAADVEAVVEREPPDCCPAQCSRACMPGSCCLCLPDTEHGRRWDQLRRLMLRITEHAAFEGVVLCIILASSVTLCFEDIYLDERPTMKFVLQQLNIVFTVLFAMEMIAKWIAMGFKGYFSELWSFLDFLIVMVSIVDLMTDALATNVSQISAMRVLRALRAFRPLRTISRWEGMKIVVNCLVRAIPSIGNVLLVCMLFWLIFSITGVQLFKGKFFKCVDAGGNRLEYSVVKNRAQCENSSALGYQWRNSLIHFDNVVMGYIALFQVATFEGWMEVMRDAVDSTAIDEQPRRENQMVFYLYFVVFIVFGAFFTLNLFIGVIIDNFNSLKKKRENVLEVFLTPSQRNYYHTMRKLGKKKPQKTIRRPKNRFQEFFFDVAVSNKFELTIVFLIFLNMMAMMVEHYKQQPAITQCLEVVNIAFTTVFTMEAVIKIIGLRWHYFRRAWNVFDFIIVVLSIVGAVLSDIVSSVFVTPTLLRVVRIFRIGRVLRLIKAAKGIRKLLFALIISLPALGNIGALLLLVMFIYAIIGMIFFGNVIHNGALNDLVNFETFGRSMVLLFRLTTSAGWNDILYSLMVQPPDCNSTHVIRNGVAKVSLNGNCSIPEMAIVFMASFVFVTRLIVINLYIAIILENFNQAHEQEEVGITDDDFDMFYLVWERYDPHASQYIKYDQLSEFVDDLDEPLGIPKPNIIAITSFDIPIVEGDKLHCLDVLVALVRHVLGDIEDSDHFRNTLNEIEKKFRETFPTRVRTVAISTTMRRKKEDIAAKTLQRAWRRHKVQRAFRQVTENAMALAGKPLTSLPPPPGPAGLGSAASVRHAKPSKPAPPHVPTCDELELT